VFLILLSGFIQEASASHIVGGEMTYKCLGGLTPTISTYQVQLDIYQDCLTGLPQAIADDNPAYIYVYNAATGQLVERDTVFLNSFLIVPPNFSNSCINNIPSVCLRKVSFITQFNLPNENGYYVVYQRCCRNESILNLQTPDEIGATYFCKIPPVSVTVSCNNSANFKNYPPQIICINNPLIYDHSAFDPDGDSLSYEFCETYKGGSNNDQSLLLVPQAKLRPHTHWLNM
jgi:hypothetical protein